VSELLAIGISHKTAPLALRERLAMTEAAAEEFIRELVAHEEIREAVVISTCNRTEVYIVSRESVDAESVLLARLAHRAGIRPTELVDIVYSPRNCDAARHLFKVTAGLDSMIVGEHEIQGQVRRSYETALGAGTTGPFTNRLFRAGLQAGKRVRSETALGTARVSVPSVAVDLARETVGPLEERSVVVIGAGETAELTARALSEQGVRTLFVANRRVDRARELASELEQLGVPNTLETCRTLIEVGAADAAYQVERSGRSADFQEIAAAFPRLQEELRILHDAMDQFLKTSSS